MIDEGYWKSLALGLLEGLDTRIGHVERVASQATLVAEAVFADQRDRDLLVSAAWVHDIGYSKKVAITGFHHLDGALYLASIGELRLACLVAHHSSGTEEARARGLSDELTAFPFKAGLMSDCLSYCDMSIGPTGKSVGLKDRIADVVDRYGLDSPVAQGLQQAYPRLKTSFDNVERLMIR
ncbi:HD domain-containing protein [Ferrimicrobium acidiphilum]|uniref:HD domain-containing protein n=1 Tax=Ferrimicrobium acidiphilum TaxID=121039 RepID=UPI0023F212E0|nr:HD domain-containing protein [Ferrimicrobium acidiphilum]